MSGTDQHRPQSSHSTTTVSSDTVRDIFLWRRKKLSISVLFVSTAVWVLFNVYQFNFITVASWLALSTVVLLFLYGNLVRIFRKEEPSISGMEISQETVIEVAHKIRESIEEGIRWMLHLSTQREWLVFVKVVVGLLSLSCIGRFFDFLTFVYVGIVTGMIIPVTYIKNEDRIRRFTEWMTMQVRRFYRMVDEKVLKKLKGKPAKVHVKEKKAE